LAELAEIKVAEEILRSESAPTSSETQPSVPPGAGSQMPDSVQQQSLLMDEVKQDILTNLDVIEDQVKGNRKMSLALRDQLVAIIEQERNRVSSIKIQPPPQAQPATGVTHAKN
jgi:hypothetical protein